MSERQWQLSLEAPQDPEIQELHRIVSSIVDNQDSLAGEILNSMSGGFISWRDRDITNPRSMVETVSRFLTSDDVKTMSPQERIRIMKALALDERSEWGYGRIVETDTLFGGGENVAVRMPGTSATPYVTSGLVGYDLLGRSKRVDRLVGNVDRSPLDRMILIGGLAISTTEGEYLTESSVSYKGQLAQGLVPVTRIGADFHGDFRMSRGSRFVSEVTDPLGNKWPFGPIIPEALIAAYHSTEPQMLASILFHYSRKIGMTGMNEMYYRIHEKLETAGFEGNGRNMYGDYGDDSSRDIANDLRMRLTNDHEGFAYLDSFSVKPGNFELAMQIRASSDGIIFDYVGNGMEGNEPVIIPDNEIEDFIVTLFSNGHGRTSPDTLHKILEVFS